MFFEEQSDEASKAGQVSLRAWAGGPVQADCTSLFFGVKLIFVAVMLMFVKIRFVKVKNFRSNSNQFLVILILSSELVFFTK